MLTAPQNPWQTFVDSFGLDKPGTAPWDANLLDQNYSGASHGEKCTISFLLSVWNAEVEWMSGAFDIHDAISTWENGGTEHVAFLKWAASPWWP